MLGKFLLATTQDQAHRLYLRDGIFAEVTLRFQAGQFEPWPWTYADYQEQAVLAAFLKEQRRLLQEQVGRNGPNRIGGLAGFRQRRTDAPATDEGTPATDPDPSLRVRLTAALIAILSG